MFPTARWKAYLNRLHCRDKDSAPAEPHQSIYQIYHSQRIWFTRDEDNGHIESARANLDRCDALLAECAVMVNDLEETLANTPKPSTVLDWSRLW